MWVSFDFRFFCFHSVWFIDWNYSADPPALGPSGYWSVCYRSERRPIQTARTRLFGTCCICSCTPGPTERCIRNRRACEWTRNLSSLSFRRYCSPVTIVVGSKKKKKQSVGKDDAKHLIAPTVGRQYRMWRVITAYLSEPGQVIDGRLSGAHLVVCTSRVRWKHTTILCQKRIKGRLDTSCWCFDRYCCSRYFTIVVIVFCIGVMANKNVSEPNSRTTEWKE